jgi:hypothetical protein
MPRSFRRLSLVLAAFALLGLGPHPILAQIIGCEGVEPYVFILLDTSETMNRSADCSQPQFDAGECGFVCSGIECSTPTAGDHPGSKIYQTRQALYEVLSGLSNIRFGFASLNQDTLSVRAMHWLYEAASPGPNLLGGIPYPAVGAREAFGLVWSCGSGTGDFGVGCSASAPADLPDAWELSRVRRLPKGGLNFGDTVSVYVRNGSTTYKVTYQPVPGGVLGGPIQTTVTTLRCTNVSCTTTTLMGSQSVSWTPVGDFLSFDNAMSTPSRTEPATWFPQSLAADASAVYPQCTSVSVGWDPNTDSTADTANGYDLRWPTDSSDVRGAAYTLGDVVPLDWLDDHRDEILVRLAPNLAVDPLATPDFRTATYFQDTRQGGEFFLRLRNESVRPLVALGPSSVAKAITAFRQWFDDCTSCNDPNWVTTAQMEDPLWACRQKYLLVVSDGGDTCQTGSNPNADVASLYSKKGLKTYVFAVGVPANSDLLLKGLATNGRGLIYYPQTRQQLVDALNSFFASIQP